jgi:peptidyl-tRNA hydrolase, PTH1 family
MKVIVGLGNPGAEFAGTRHNVGREIVESIARASECNAFEPDKKLSSLVSKGTVGGEKATLLLPETYMNKSGKALAALAPKPKNLIVIHDDVDLPLGTIKVSFGKNSGGHKGVESIMRAIKSKDFWRIRVGVQKKKRVDAMKLVLAKFTPAEKLIVKKLQKKIIETLERDLQITTISL